MAPKKVLKISRTDQDSSFVLIHVSPKGSRPLDLKLVATEGSAPYACSLRHDRVASLRVKHSPVSETEWQDILVSIVQQKLLTDIQVTATVQDEQDESAISLTVRKQVQGITQRLGVISLSHAMDEVIELFDWCAISVDALNQSLESATNSAAELSTVQASVEDLKSQLEELIRAKQEDELALLQKCRHLLNEKKVKIRQQHTVISHLSAAGTRAREEPMSTEEQPQPKQSKRTATKRKAKAVEPDEPMEDISTPVRPEPEYTDTDNPTEATASASSGDEDEEEDESTNKPQGSGPVTSESETAKKPGDAPPPPRRLPFQRRKPAATANDTGDIDSDDEL